MPSGAVSNRPLPVMAGLARRWKLLSVLVAAALTVNGCGLLDQPDDRDVFTDAAPVAIDPAPPDLDGEAVPPGSSRTERTTPLPALEPQSRPVLRVNGDEGSAASGIDIAGTGGGSSSTAGDDPATTTTAPGRGGPAPTTRPASPTTPSPTGTADDGRGSFPTSNVVRLQDGQKVTFQSQVAPGGTPVLAWLWAPGSTICMADAPNVEQFAQQYTTRLLVAGLAVTSRVDRAQAFVDQHRLKTPLTLVDTHYSLSDHYDVTGVPTWILFDAGGNELARGSRVDSRLEQAVEQALAR